MEAVAREKALREQIRGNTGISREEKSRLWLAIALHRYEQTDTEELWRCCVGQSLKILLILSLTSIWPLCCNSRLTWRPMKENSRLLPDRNSSGTFKNPGSVFSRMRYYAPLAVVILAAAAVRLLYLREISYSPDFAVPMAGSDAHSTMNLQSA